MGTYYQRTNSWGRTYTCYRRSRNTNDIKKKTDYVKSNDKLKMLGILFSAAYRASENKGLTYKTMRVFLNVDAEAHDGSRMYNYLNIDISKNNFNYDGRIYTNHERIWGKRKSQIVKV
jgi:hypothetical protein